MAFLSIDQGLCAREGACVDSCPYSLIRFGAEGFPEEVAGAAGRCVRCGHCVSICATGALTNNLLDMEGFRPVSELANEPDPVARVMLERRSVRVFLPEPVPKQELSAMLEVASRAPTANNAQNLWWIVTLGREQTRPLARLARQWLRKTYWPETPESQWPEDDDPVLRGAPHLLLCCAPADSRWGPTDAAIAVAHLNLLATSRGLGACWAGVFLRAVAAHPPLAEELGLPGGQKACAGLFLGRPRYRYGLLPPRKPCAVVWR